jgi:sugar phosphate isomerase/epimerase
MIRSGLVSVTFRQLAPQQIVELAVRAGLCGIEWGGDVHVPHGETAIAREVRRITQEAGLEVAAYGSYYRVGASEDEGLSFSHVLHTALELEAPVVRVWAGTQNAEDASDEYFRLVVNEMGYICDKAEQAGLAIATEFHRGTLCNTAAATSRLLGAVNRPNLKTLWQPPVGMSASEATESLRELLPCLAHLHVFQWDGVERRSLAEGADVWREYLAVVKDRAAWALLEFVPEDDPEFLCREAQTLNDWIAQSDRSNSSD